MRKIILGLVVAGFALIVFISVRPFTDTLTINPEPPQTEMAEEKIVMEPAPYFSVSQGDSYRVLSVTNNLSEQVNFSLGHEHSHITFNPRDATLYPGRTREIAIEVGHQCLPGGIDLPVYLRAETNGERFGVEKTLNFEVTEGSISLDYNDNGLQVFWDDEPSPRGVLVTYRSPGEADWRIWGETPRLAAPDHLSAGEHEFEFKARLGEVESPVAVFVISVEAKIAEEEEPEDKPTASISSGSAASSNEPEKGTIDWKGGTYTGQLRNGIPHQQGVWTHPDGREYTGDFNEGSMEGRDTMIFPGGEVYRGQFIDNVAHGVGMMTHPLKGTIRGNWVKGQYVPPDEKPDEKAGEWWYEN